MYCGKCGAVVNENGICPVCGNDNNQYKINPETTQVPPVVNNVVSPVVTKKPTNVALYAALATVAISVVTGVFSGIMGGVSSALYGALGTSSMFSSMGISSISGAVSSAITLIVVLLGTFLFYNLALKNSGKEYIPLAFIPVASISISGYAVGVINSLVLGIFQFIYNGDMTFYSAILVVISVIFSIISIVVGAALSYIVTSKLVKNIESK